MNATTICVCLCTAILFFAFPCNARGDVEITSSWGWSNLKKVNRKTKKETTVGIALYTKQKKALGAAFRCEKKRLYAFLTMKPMNIQERMFQNFRGPTRWKVRYSIDGMDEAEEEWVSIENGNLMMVIPKPTSLAMFEAAKSGTVITVAPRNGKAVTISLPPDSIGLFDRFAERCGLKPPRNTPSSESVAI